MIHFHTLRVKTIHRELSDTIAIDFEVPDALREVFRYDAGQYLTLRHTIEGEEVRRSYSLCSAPHEDRWQVAIKAVPGGKFSAWANTMLREGDAMEVMPPQGRFVVRPDTHARLHHIFFAAGSGITPVIGMIKSLLEDESKSQITLFYGNRHKRSVIFLEELERLKNKYMGQLSLHFIFSQEDQASSLFEGRIDSDRCGQLLEQFVPNDDRNRYYICGPEGMIRDVQARLERNGVPKGYVHFELFTTPVEAAQQLTVTTDNRSEPTDGKESVASVQVRLDGRVYSFELPYNGKNILDASMVTGADLPFSCKGGVCCTCRAKLIEGEVHMKANYALEDWEVNEGFILTCQSHPRSNKLFVDFDQQ